MAASPMMADAAVQPNATASSRLRGTRLAMPAPMCVASWPSASTVPNAGIVTRLTQTGSPRAPATSAVSDSITTSLASTSNPIRRPPAIPSSKRGASARMEGRGGTHGMLGRATRAGKRFVILPASIFFHASMVQERLPSSRALVAFASAARHGSFTAAARELALTQSAVSHQVIALEQAVGTPLFVRTGRQLTLTREGEFLLRESSKGLETIAAAIQDLRQGRGGTHQIELGTVPTFGTRWLLPRLAAFTHAHPEVRVHLHSRIMPFEFAGTALDAVVYCGDGNWPGAHCVRLAEDRCAVVASPSLTRSARLREPADLLAQPLLHQPTRPRDWQAWLQKAGVLPPAALAGARLEEFAMIIQAAVHGMGFALVPELLAQAELQRGELVKVFSRVTLASRSYFLVIPQARLGHGPLQLLVHWLSQPAQPSPERTDAKRTRRR
jgi:LysR family transcriptional regulator, glycine cleavage system transcriptional activator